MVFNGIETGKKKQVVSGCDENWNLYDKTEQFLEKINPVFQWSM